jgi:hypothetical protein
MEATTLRNKILKDQEKVLSGVVKLHYNKILHLIQLKVLCKHVIYPFPKVLFIPGIRIEFLSEFKEYILDEIIRKLKQDKYDCKFIGNDIHISWELGYDKNELKMYLSEVLYTVYEKIRKVSKTHHKCLFTVPLNVRYDYELVMNHVIQILVQKKYNVTRIRNKVIEIKW